MSAVAAPADFHYFAVEPSPELAQAFAGTATLLLVVAAVASAAPAVRAARVRGAGVLRSG